MTSKTSVSNSTKSAAPDMQFDERFRALLGIADRKGSEAACRDFLRDYPKRPEAHYLLARALLEVGKKRHAFPYAEAAHKLAPDNPHFTYYLGYLYLEFRLYEYALPLLRTAMATDSSIPQFHEALGECYSEIGKGERAVTYFKTALKLTTDSDASRRLKAKLAHTLTMTNMLDEADAVIRSLLDGDEASRRMGMLETARFSNKGSGSPEAALLRSLLDDESLDDKKRVDVMLRLGVMLERDRKYDEAFDHWRKAREISKAGDWKLRDQLAHYDECTRFYTPELMAAAGSYGHKTEAPVFIVGMPRSGTTLTEQIIAAHPQAVGVGELGRFHQLDMAFRADYPETDRIRNMVRNAEAGELRARAEETLRIFDVVADVRRDRVVEKTPHNFRNLGYLKLLFPNAHFIHCRRHPLDAFISSYQNNLNPTHGYAFSQTQYAKEYLYQERMMTYWKSLFPGQIFTLPYEAMAHDPNENARSLINFLGLPWHDDCLRFFEKAKTVRTFSSQQVRSAVHASSVERWRRYEKHLRPIIQALEEVGFNYQDT